MKVKKIDESQLPLYEILIDENDDTGMKLISLVDEPAIGVMGMMFSEEKRGYQFKSEEDKQIIVGPALIPNLKIKRKIEDGMEYYVTFSTETIEKMVQKFNRIGSNRRINIDHSDRMVDGFIMEDWIIEDAIHDKSKKYGFDLPVGTYMIKVKIEDKDFWMNEVKNDGKYGFSIEGLLDQKLVKMSSDESEGSTIEDLDIIDLCYIFDVFSDCDHIDCNCSEKKNFKLEALPGLIHPSCKCDLMLGDFSKSANYIGKNGKEYPCILCDQAKKNWDRSGKFRDVFGNNYSKIDVFPYYVKKTF